MSAEIQLWAEGASLRPYEVAGEVNFSTQSVLYANLSRYLSVAYADGRYQPLNNVLTTVAALDAQPFGLSVLEQSTPQSLRVLAGASRVAISEVPPEQAAAGDRWVQTTTGTEYVWTVTVSGSQWVEF